MTKRLTTLSETETTAVGRELAGRLPRETTIVLFGELGAGKTAFVRGLAEGLGVDPSEVSSPTFTLIQQYRGGRLPLYHVDLYRLNHAREVDDHKLPRPIPGAIAVHIEYGEGDTRVITVERG
ncbi:MAG: tRNA (adenosine(37)-N6)-threonylcarbamoyltransferase complex ATPase subunit type 1 TsaE [Acidobacteria bacterium]|nr:MAG: tRNA (adenosine(37)-N6)-threonylcarbamoyltransferase complex ATPase subunit type 1 TsaE [Acidobacteriota bacterium]